MSKQHNILIVCLALAPAAYSQAPAQHAALLKQYCVSCHSEKLKTAGMVLENRDLSKVPADAQIWEKVVRKMRAGEMPPQGLPRPDKAASDGLVTYWKPRSTLPRPLMLTQAARSSIA